MVDRIVLDQIVRGGQISLIRIKLNVSKLSVDILDELKLINNRPN